MSSKRILTAIACALALAGAPSAAQGQRGEVRVTAQLSTGVAKPGERVVLAVVADNALEGAIAGVPQVDGLQIRPFGEPSSERSTSFVQGKVTQTARISWSTSVVPERAGEFTIPPFVVQIGAQQFQTAPLVLTVVADLKGEELGFIQVVPSSMRVIEGQPFSVEIRFGFDERKTQNNFCNLKLPWWGQLPGTLDVQAPARTAPPRNLYVFIDARPFEDFEELPPQRIGNGTFRAWRIVRSYTPTRQGRLEFPTSFLEFGRLVRRDNFFSSNLERAESFFARAPGFEIDVVPLPEEGRPLDYGGAIGHLEVKANAEPRDVDAGESIKLEVSWSGEGNLEFFDPPDPSRQDAFRGFRVYGRTEIKSFDRRTVVYDIAPLAPQVREIPPLDTPVFDPEQERYVRIATNAIPIHVRPLAAANPLAAAGVEERGGADLADIDARAAPRSQLPALPAGGVIGAVVAAPVLGLLLRAAMRRRGDPAAPAERRRRRAVKELARALGRADGPRAQLDAFCEFLGARTREPRAAWVGRDLRREHVNGSVGALPVEQRGELQGLLSELEGAAFSAGGRTLPRERILTVAQQLIGGGL